MKVRKNRLYKIARSARMDGLETQVAKFMRKGYRLHGTIQLFRLNKRLHFVQALVWNGIMRDKDGRYFVPDNNQIIIDAAGKGIYD